MPFESVADVLDYAEYRRVLKAELGRLKAKKKYVRYFKKFVFADRRVRPLLLLGPKPRTDALVKALSADHPGPEKEKKKAEEVGENAPPKRAKPKEPASGYCHRSPGPPNGPIYVEVVRGKIREADLRKLVARAGVTADVRVTRHVTAADRP